MDKSVENRFKVELYNKYDLLKKVMLPKDEYFKTIEKFKDVCK